MTLLEVALPGSILGLAFVIKLVVDRTANIPDLFQALFELPVDIVFLAASLVAGYILSNKAHAPEAMLAFIGLLVAAIFVVVLWRRSQSLFIANALITSVLCSILSYAISVSVLVAVVSLIAGVTP